MSANTRENLLVTMALYAGEMDANGNIYLPHGIDGEDELADFCVECVDAYLHNEHHITFGEYAEQCLMESFGQQKDHEPIEEEGQYKVIAVAGSVEKDLGIRGTYDECERWCDCYDWVWRPDGEGGFEWELYVEEV